MAFAVTGPLRLLGYKDGRPVFDLPSAPAAPAPVRAAAGTTAPAPAPAPAPAAARGPKDLYGGDCVRPGCGVWVAPQAGERLKADGRWAVRHLPGECPPGGVEKPEEEPVRQEPRESAPAPAPARGPICTPDGKEPDKGYFTAQFGDDSEDYVTIRLRRQPELATFRPGQLIVAFLTGRDNEGDYTKVGDVDEAGRCWLWARYRGNQRLREAIASVLGDQRAAGEAWARASQRCWSCGKQLTTPSSLEQLMGDECWAKSGYGS